MNPNKALWEKGDFTRIAQSMRASPLNPPEPDAGHPYLTATTNRRRP